MANNERPPVTQPRGSTTPSKEDEKLLEEIMERVHREMNPSADKDRMGNPKDGAPFIAVALTVYEWHELLEVLKFQCTFVNSNLTDNAKRSFERVALQLHGYPVKIEWRPTPPR